MDVRFQEVRSTPEIAAVVELAGVIWREYYSPLIGRPQVDYMLDKFQSPTAVASQQMEGFRYFLALSAGEPLGYFAIVPKTGYLFISKLYVAAHWRGQGVGRRMAAFCEELALRQGLIRLRLTVAKRNASSIQAYRRWGFSITESVLQDIGQGFVMDDYVMEKVCARPESRP